MDLPGANELLSGVVSGIVGGGGIGGLFLLYLQRYQNRVDAMEQELAALSKSRVADLEDTVEDHLDADQSQKILSELSHLSGAQSRMELNLSVKIDKLTDRNAETNAALASLKSLRDGDRSFIENLNKSLQQHQSQKHAN